jgi:hypothetical protein
VQRNSLRQLLQSIPTHAQLSGGANQRSWHPPWLLRRATSPSLSQFVSNIPVAPHSRSEDEAWLSKVHEGGVPKALRPADIQRVKSVAQMNNGAFK